MSALRMREVMRAMTENYRFLVLRVHWNYSPPFQGGAWVLFFSIRFSTTPCPRLEKAGVFQCTQPEKRLPCSRAASRKLILGKLDVLPSLLFSHYPHEDSCSSFC